MLQRIVGEYQGPNLITERFRHKESLLEADLGRERIYVRNPHSFPLEANETSYVLEFIEKWNELSFSLPGNLSGGNPLGGINSISYYPANSNKEELCITGHDSVLKYIQSEEWRTIIDKIDKAVEELNKKVANSLKKGSLQACISRFDLEIYRTDTTHIDLVMFLNKAEMNGMKEFISMYEHRKGSYYAITK